MGRGPWSADLPIQERSSGQRRGEGDYSRPDSSGEEGRKEIERMVRHDGRQSEQGSGDGEGASAVNRKDIKSGIFLSTVT